MHLTEGVKYTPRVESKTEVAARPGGNRESGVWGFTPTFAAVAVPGRGKGGSHNVLVGGFLFPKNAFA